MRIRIPVKLALVLIVVSALPLVIATTLAYVNATARETAHAEKDILRCARDTARMVGHELQSLFDQARVMSAGGVVTEHLRESQEPARLLSETDAVTIAADDEPLRTILSSNVAREARRLLGWNPAFREIVIIDSRGMTLAATHRPARFLWRDSDWWDSCFNAGRTVVKLDEVDAAPVLRVFLPILDNGNEALGVIQILIDAEAVLRPIRELVASDSTEIDIVYDSKVISSTNSERVGRVISTAIDADGSHSVDLYKRIIRATDSVNLAGGQANLLVHVQRDASQVFEPMRKRHVGILIFGGSSIVIFFIIGFGILNSQIMIPIRRLITGARTLADGDLTHRIDPRLSVLYRVTGARTDDELDDLASEFNSMANALTDSRTSLEEKVKLRTRELAEETTRSDQSRVELEQALNKLQQTQANLIQTEKLASLGLLVAGVAHEINNPLSFVLNNITVIQRDYSAILSILIRYRNLRLAGVFDDATLREIAETEDDVDIDYIAENPERIFASTMSGLNRVKTIVADLKDFSRLEEREYDEISIERSLDTTLELVGFHLVSKGIHVVRDYGNVPAVTCYSGRMNQVFLNLIMNAIQSMDDGGTLTLRTALEDENVIIEITDTGHGIDTQHLSKIFDPFFTTKKQGEGTGLGLSVSYGIIREHHGSISVSSKSGDGSVFTISLPQKGPEAQNECEN